MGQARSRNLTEIQFETFIDIAEFLILYEGNSILKGKAHQLQIAELIQSGPGVKNSLFTKNHSIAFGSIKSFYSKFSEITKKQNTDYSINDIKDYKEILDDWYNEVKENITDTKSVFGKEITDIEFYKSIIGEYNFYLKWTPCDDIASMIDLSISYLNEKLLLKIVWDISKDEKGTLEGEGIIDLESKVLCSTMFGRLKNSEGNHGTFGTSPTFLILTLPSREITKTNTLSGILTGARDFALGVVSRLVVVVKKDIVQSQEEEKLKNITEFLTFFRNQAWVEIPKHEKGIPIFLYDHLNAAMENNDVA